MHQDIAAHYRQQTCTYRVRSVPYRHFGCQLRRWYPMGQQTRAGRKATTLADVVDNQQHTEDKYQHIDKLRTATISRHPLADVGTTAECEVDDGTEGQSDRHMYPGICSGGNASVRET